MSSKGGAASGVVISLSMRTFFGKCENAECRDAAIQCHRQGEPEVYTVAVVVQMLSTLLYDLVINTAFVY